MAEKEGERHALQNSFSRLDFETMKQILNCNYMQQRQYKMLKKFTMSGLMYKMVFNESLA